MESSRDSSVWRNLAVTFGGGLALGAVGMRLTQSAIRPAELAPRPGIQPLPSTVDDRLERMERRLERMEQTPAASHVPVSAQIDHKVLEAVVGAVDARIREHAGQVERRIADLEARFTVELQSLHQQNGQIGEQFRQEAAALRTAVTQDFRQLADNASKTAAEQASIRAELETLNQQDERLRESTAQGLAGLRQEYRAELAVRVDALQHSMETRLVTAAAAAAAGQLEDQMAPLRAEVQRKEQELAVLRQRLAESERTVLDMVVSIGQVCRQAAERMGGAPEIPPAATLSADPTPASAPIAAPAAPEPAKPETSAVSSPAAPQPLVSAPQLSPPVSIAQAVPNFLSESNGSRSWRIPLVSSFFLVLTTGCMALIHYL